MAEGFCCHVVQVGEEFLNRYENGYKKNSAHRDSTKTLTWCPVLQYLNKILCILQVFPIAR